MAKKAKPAAKSAKKTSKTVSRKPERSKGELSSEDLDQVAGGIIIQGGTVARRDQEDREDRPDLRRGAALDQRLLL